MQLEVTVSNQLQKHGIVGFSWFLATEDWVCYLSKLQSCPGTKGLKRQQRGRAWGGGQRTKGWEEEQGVGGGQKD